jgi:hypothetical protein
VVVRNLRGGEAVRKYIKIYELDQMPIARRDRPTSSPPPQHLFTSSSLCAHSSDTQQEDSADVHCLSCLSSHPDLRKWRLLQGFSLAGERVPCSSDDRRAGRGASP